MDFRSFVLLLFGLVTVFAQTTAPNTGQPVFSTLNPPLPCETYTGTNCEQCLTNATCLWCQTTKTCITYPASTILPSHAFCPLNNARWGLCWMNFQTLIITLSVVGAIIILAFLVCLFCCCKCERIGSSRFMARMEQEDSKTKEKQAERKEEMKIRHEEIRKKYGLYGSNPYSKFS
ncbi:hypothetical protein UPYG_G00020430 [Umbra pygmaea]|uniref:PTTG1 interacting protein n=1 Tax=Umbra pygmaea TaxID=75934 RepID=A0ABD0Y1G3_UMBPY